MARLTYLVVLVCLTCSPAAAHYQFRSVDEWAMDMIKKLPFSESGILSRDKYRDVSRRYVEKMTAFHVELAKKKRDFALQNGRPNLAKAIDRRKDRQIEIIKTYAYETSEGVMNTLDPEKAGEITIEKALQILTEIARQTDFNHNGVLEPAEAEIAEAALVRGFNVNDPDALEKLLETLDRETW